MTALAERVAQVRERIAASCRRAGRDPEEVRLVAVTKGLPAAAVDEVASVGVTDVAENRAAELEAKRAESRANVRWHFVGTVQRRRVRQLDGVALVHSVDRVEEARALAVRHPRDVLVEVNVSGEQAKQGVQPADLPSFLAALSEVDGLGVKGLMIMAPEAKNPEDVRWVFGEARRLRDRLRRDHHDLEELSMGMSDDFEVAVEEGATLVRIGRAIFRED